MRLLSERVRMLETKAEDFRDAANRAFVVLKETPEPIWDDERDINNRIQEAHDILDTVLMKYFEAKECDT